MEVILQKFYDNLFLSLEELWIAFSKQVPGIVLAILIIAVGLLLARLISNLSRKAIARRTDDPITVNFLSKAIKLLCGLLVIMYALRVAGLGGIAAGVLTAAGASAVIIGFAFRDIGENFISGIILSFNRPFNVDETVRVGDIFGKIKTIEFRYTKLRTFDGRDVYIPNSDVIKKPVFNYTEDGYFRFEFTVGISYEDDIEDAMKVILEVLETTKTVVNDETHPYFVYPDELGVSSVNLEVKFWVKTFEYGMEALTVKGQVVSAVKEALLARGFNLPAQIIEMKLYDEQDSIPVSIKE
ncbi:MAG: mechanosensitive ion channel family protein [Pyrinomonadaceae bacterium]|nr:mechanosensitive ion channel family protein [Pyrinomonadaceae bacterium]